MSKIISGSGGGFTLLPSNNTYVCFGEEVTLRCETNENTWGGIFRSLVIDTKALDWSHMEGHLHTNHWQQII